MATAQTRMRTARHFTLTGDASAMNVPTPMHTGPLGSTVSVLRVDAETVPNVEPAPGRVPPQVRYSALMVTYWCERSQVHTRSSAWPRPSVIRMTISSRETASAPAASV